MGWKKDGSYILDERDHRPPRSKENAQAIARRYEEQRKRSKEYIDFGSNAGSRRIVVDRRGYE